MNFKNLIEATQYFSIPQNCIDYLVKARWNGKITCVFCNCDKVYTLKGLNKRYKCSKCAKHFSITKGTIFEKSQIPLNKWLVAVFILTTHKKGISSVQLAIDIGVTQKSAWFMAHRIRQSLKSKDKTLLNGIVEMDEAHMGRKYRSQFKGLPPEEVERMRKADAKLRTKNKGTIAGLKQRDGRVIAQVIDQKGAESISKVVKEYVSSDAMLMTDEALYYRKIFKEFKRQTVNHSKREWVRGNVTTNRVENFWSVLKRGIYGIYYQVHVKHLQRYCDEYAFRFNARTSSNKTKFDNALSNVHGRLTLKELTGKKVK
ncbi:MAG: IS1595 family transposase [Ferruginibacter sp.]|nr:IS1595 family transposase [Ferruginibacter sp.]